MLKIMEFTQIERIAIAHVLIDLMNVDEVVDIRETLYMNQIRNALNISEAEIQAGKEQNALVALLTLRSMNNEKKYALGVILKEMIDADGKVARRELRYFNVVFEAVGMKEAVEDINSKVNDIIKP